MAVCPDCAQPLDIDEEGLAVGDIVACQECGAKLEVVDVDGPELQPAREEAELDDEPLPDGAGYVERYRSGYNENDDEEDV